MRFTLRRVPLALLIAGAIQVPASATENGQISYPFGVNTVLNGCFRRPATRSTSTIRFTTRRTGSPGRAAAMRCRGST